MEGIHIIRVWTYITANEGFIKRTLDYISFSVSAFIAGLFQKNRYNHCYFSPILHSFIRTCSFLLEKKTLDHGSQRSVA